jgi:ABC-type branched-subunit amino acid transport system substrate-binding protein
MRSHARCRAALGVVLTAATLAAVLGCGDGAANGPRPITIGALVPVTGLGLPYYMAAFSAAVRSINAHGGIRGRPVRLENCDDRNDPNLAQACARQLVGDGVVATVGDISTFSMVEAPILDEAGIAQVGNTALNPEDSTLPTAFPLTGGLVDLMAGSLVGMKRRGLHSLFVVTTDTPPGRLIVQLAGQLVRGAGVSLAGASYTPLAATDLGAYVQAAVQSKTEVVFPALAPPMTIQYAMASRHGGAKYQIAVPYGEFRPRDIEQMGGRQAITENDIEFSTLPPLSAADRFPAIRAFLADMDAEQRAGDSSATPELRTGGSLTAWLCVQIVARLAATLPTVDAPAMLRALRTSSTVDTLGLTPPWTPGRTGLPTAPRLTNLFGYLVSQRNGVEVLVDPTPFDPLQALGLET